jgi:hypothetical protein
MLPFPGHLGASVSALVDDQLDPAHAARAWSHVEGCPGCRAAVDQELWVKQRLAAAGPVVPQPVLTGSLCTLPDAAPRGWPFGEPPPRRHGVRRAGLAALGVGTVSAALVGLGSLVVSGEPPAGRTPSATVEGGSPSGAPTAGFRSVPPGGAAARLGLPRP